jgi:hypothetical protein
VASWRGKGEANIVKWLMRSIASARDERRLSRFDLYIGVAIHFDRVVCEDSSAVVVADFANR